MDNSKRPGRSSPDGGGLRLADELKMESPGWYQIIVQGFLDTDWSDRLGGLNILPIETPSGTVTSLTGEVIDQTALMGILSALYDFHYPLLSIMRLEPAQR
jgi:hypothetical protein